MKYDKPPKSEPAPHGYERLERLGPAPTAQAGCPFGLGLLLTLLGGGSVALYFVEPAGKGSPWVMLVVGGLFAVVGLFLLLAGIIGLRGLRVRGTELFLEKGAVLRPGSRASFRLRQSGPVTFDSLVVLLVAERVYRRVVSEKSGSTVEDQQRLYEATLLELTGQRIPAGRSYEEVMTVEIPADAPPTGPALPDGQVRWRLEIRGDAGVLRGTYHSFVLRVGA